MMFAEQQPARYTNAQATETAAEDAAADIETRLQRKRETLRLLLAKQQDASLWKIGVVARMAVRLARQMVRQHPYGALAGAALAGLWLVRAKPWRALGGPILAGVMARQVLAYTLSSGNRLFRHLISRDRDGMNRPL